MKNITKASINSARQQIRIKFKELLKDLEL